MSQQAELSIEPILYSKLVVSEFNPRDKTKEGDPDWSDFVADVEEHGIETPIEVSPLDDGRFEVIKGSRRYHAWEEVNSNSYGKVHDGVLPCIVIPRGEADEKLVASMRENIHRANLTQPEATAAVQRLLKMGHKQKEIAKELNKSPAWVSMVNQGKSWTAQKKTSVSKQVPQAREFEEVDCPACGNLLKPSIVDGAIQLEVVGKEDAEEKRKPKRHKAKKAPKGSSETSVAEVYEGEGAEVL